jgi:hypothetical protein
MSKVAAQLTCLEHLNLRYTMRVSDATALSLSRHARRLRTLNLSQCPRLTAATAEALASHPHIPHTLQALRLMDCQGIAAGALALLLSRLSASPAFCLVDVRGCALAPGGALAVLNVAGKAAGTGVWAMLPPGPGEKKGVFVRGEGRLLSQRQSCLLGGVDLS